MRIAIFYQSKSGNTKAIAEEIYDCLYGEEVTLHDIDKTTVIPKADIYFVGFGVHNYNCSMGVVDFFEELDRPNLALFMTSGLLPTEKYKDKISENVKVWLPDECNLIASYMCQGKTEAQVQEIIISKYKEAEDELIKMFEEGANHPNYEDISNARKFARFVVDIAGDTICD